MHKKTSGRVQWRYRMWPTLLKSHSAPPPWHRHTSHVTIIGLVRILHLQTPGQSDCASPVKDDHLPARPCATCIQASNTALAMVDGLDPAHGLSRISA